MLSDQTRVTAPSEFVRYEKAELERSIVDRFERIVLLYPERLAVKSQTGQLTYDELNRNANRIAWALLNQKGEVHEPVGLLVEDKCQAIAAILGVLKSGRFYLPFNASAPHDRFTSRLQDSQTRVLITDRKNLDATTDLVCDQCAVLGLDELVSTASIHNPELTISPDAIAAIFYTSGSNRPSERSDPRSPWRPAQSDGDHQFLRYMRERPSVSLDITDLQCFDALPL
jgi:non-ribosomal peptide synthetase component F